MRPLEALGLRVASGRLEILDQRALPHVEQWVDASDPKVMVGLIQTLAVRGAPLIGVAAALSAALQAECGADTATLKASLASLRKARPTAVNLMHAVDRLRHVLDLGGDRAALVAEAEAVFDEDVALCEAMASHGVSLLGPREAVLTHCNAGALATAGIGTALGVIRRGFEAGRIHHVFVDETRPLLQGARLTAWELDRLHIPHTLLTDSMAALLLRDGRVNRVLVGADRIAANGDVANKVGTYGLAVQAHHHHVPFHPVAPWTTVDLDCQEGFDIPVEVRHGDEVRGFGPAQWAPAKTPVYNPSFDVTPGHLVTSLVLDTGVVTREELASGRLLELGADSPRP